MDWNDVPVKQSFRQRLKEIFGDLKYLWYSFDDAAGAQDLLQGILTETEWADFGQVSVEGLAAWHTKYGPQVKRQRILDRELSFEFCAHPKRDTVGTIQETYEQIMKEDPRFMLDTVKRSQRRSSTGEGPETRAAKEQQERDRYALELAGILQEAVLPVSLQIEALQDPNKAWLRLFGARRSKTLRNRYRSWNRFRTLLVAYSGKTWPGGLDVLIHYVEEHIQNGVTFSFISEFQAALVVLEQAGRIPEGKQLSRDPLWKAHVESWKQELATNTFPKAAKPYTTAILLALELFVIEMDHEFCLRLIAWCMLVSTWAAMRVDDLQNVMPESVRLSNRGLTLRMARTKTTGGAKLHGPICAFVARDISISGYDWLIEGFQMLQREDLMFPRDYFIPTPGKDWTLFKNKILEPPSMANYFRIVLGKLGTPRFQDGFWRQNKAMDLVPGAMLLFWSGHSPRHFLTQAAASLGVDKTKRDFLGRWSIGRTGSNAYLHTSRQVVEEVQHLVRDSIVLGAPALDESELLEDIMHFADKHELVGQRVRRRHTHDYKRANAGEVFNTFDSDVEQVDVQEKQQVMEAVQREAGENPTHLGYFITTSRRTGFRRLHMHGKCPVRSDRCIDSTDVDNVQDAAYDAICKICQRKISEELGRMTADHDVSSDSGDSSSTNTSGDEAEAEEAEAGEASEWQPLI